MQWIIDLLPNLLSSVLGFLPGLLAAHPTILSVLTLIGGLRVIFKPLFTFLESAAAAIPGTKDDALVKAIEDSKVVKAILFVLDYIASIKLKV